MVGGETNFTQINYKIVFRCQVLGRTKGSRAKRLMVMRRVRWAVSDGVVREVTFEQKSEWMSAMGLSQDILQGEEKASIKSLVKGKYRYCYQPNGNLCGWFLETTANREPKVLFPTWRQAETHCPLVVRIKHTHRQGSIPKPLLDYYYRGLRTDYADGSLVWKRVFL